MLCMKMKSLCIFAPYALLILCGFVDWTYSHPATILEIDWANPVARKIKSDDGLTDGKYVTTGVNHGPTADPMLERVYPERNAKTTKTNKDTKSLAGNDTRGRQANKSSKTKTPTQGEKKTFLQKLRSFFVDGPVKVWNKIKQWFTRANTSKSNETNVKKPKGNWMKDLLRIFKSKTTTIEKPLKETPTDSSVHAQTSQKEIPQEETNDPTTLEEEATNAAPLKEGESQQETLVAQPLPDSNQSEKVKGTPDELPVITFKHQQSNDITVENPSSPKDLEAESERSASILEGEEDPTKVQDTEKVSQENPQQQEGLKKFDLDHMKEIPRNKDHEEEKPSVVIENKKIKPLRHEIEDEKELPIEKLPEEDKIDGTPVDSPGRSKNYQQPNDIDIENESSIEELEANSEHLAPDTEGHNYLTKIQDTDESSPEQPHKQVSLASFDSDNKKESPDPKQPHRQVSLESFDSDNKEESPGKKHPKEKKSSVINGNEKHKAPQQEIGDEEERPGNMPAKEKNHHWLLKKMKLTFLRSK